MNGCLEIGLSRSSSMQGVAGFVYWSTGNLGQLFTV